MPLSMDRRSFLAGNLTLLLLGGVSTKSFGHQGNHRHPASFVQGVNDAESKRVRNHIAAFMKKHNVPGLALAIAKAGELKLVGAFGYSNIDEKKPTRPDDLFRIASVSKPFTSVAVLRLAQRKRLSLQDKVFGRRGILGKYQDAVSDSAAANRRRLEGITVQNLLEHTCGGWGNSKNDPMFDRETMTFDHDRLIRWTLRNRPLNDYPGDHYDYSNFGYCLLGRVVEVVSGKSYEASVRKLVLEPSGIKEMRLGNENRKGRFPNEAVYVGQGEDPYHRMMRVKRMDAHGGWVASAVDLVRFAVHVDGFRTPPDVLSSAMTGLMARPSSANPNYAKGWNVNESHNWWHIGSFNGAAAILARISDGHCWAVVLNTRPRSKEFNGDLDALP